MPAASRSGAETFNGVIVTSGKSGERTVLASPIVARGVLLLHFTPRQIRVAPAEVVAQIRAALDAGRGRAPLAISTRPAA